MHLQGIISSAVQWFQLKHVLLKMLFLPNISTFI